MSNIRNLDTSRMNADELEAYKKELHRLERQGSVRLARNIRLIIYALAAIAIIVLIILTPGFVRYQQGPVVLVPPAENCGIEIDGLHPYGDTHCERKSDHSFRIYIDDGDPMEEYAFDITGDICQEPEWINRQRKSTVSFSDGEEGTIRYEVKKKYGTVDLVIERENRTFDFSWCSLEEFEQYQKHE